MMKRQKILIWGTSIYCGGALVLAELCRQLTKQGYDAKMFVTRYFPGSEERSNDYPQKYIKGNIRYLFKMALCRLFPIKRIRERFNYDYFFPEFLQGCKIKLLPIFNHRKTIVLYSEIVYGNPFQADRVIRWVLYHYPHLHESKAFSPSDLFLGFRDIFNSGLPVEHVNNVKINVFDADLYKRTNFGERSGKCYIVRKGGQRLDLPQTFDGPVIDDMTEEKKVETFNNCEYCYSYDMQTFYSSIASLCGCKSIVVPESGKVYSDYYTDDEKNWGVAFGDSNEEIIWAEDTRHLLLEKLAHFADSNTEEVSKFVDIVENYFGVKLTRNHKEN